MILIKIFGIAGAALLLIVSISEFITLLSYDVELSFENYIGYLWPWILNIILIVFFCKLKKDHIKHLLKEEHY